ncbi:MAG: flavin reductase family protein [Spirochaetia bacterium]|nr:flavin reductase family protein [Spirochaetota bacterium]MCX8095940.1 flavin reductase family protein [Spirochaetota bacterium]MDW8112224.1 flavin reductase family protein [Spirochaetia bacterium]
MKIDIDLSLTSRIFNLGNVQLVSVEYGGIKNVSTVAWITPVEKDPPLVMLSLDKSSFTFELIDKSGEFALNTPTAEILDIVKKVGSISGRYLDKFEEFKIPYSKGKYINSPILDNCIANVEFVVKSIVPMQKHAMIMGEARRATVEDTLFSDHWLLEEKDIVLIHHAGANYFCTTRFLVEIKK